MDEKLLKIENLSKSYNAQTQALADVNITLDKGEFVVVIGPSGAGKSTLIRCINRMIEPTEGKIVFDGTEITSMNNRQMRKVRKMCIRDRRICIHSHRKSGHRKCWN